MAWFYKIRLYLIYTVAITLIVLAVAFSVLRTVLPHATGYVQDVERALTEETGLPVSIASMDADMYWLVPRLKLVDVVIYDKEKKRELLRLDEAFFALAFIDSILQWSPTVGDVSLVGAELYIERHPGNRWHIQGVEFGGQTRSDSETDDVSVDDSSQEIIAALRNTSFSLLDSDIHWRDYSLRTGQLDFIGANIFIEEFLDRHSLEVNLKLPEAYGKSFRLILKLNDDISNFIESDFDAYIQGESIEIGQWFSALGIKEWPKIKGNFSGEAWFSIKDKVLSQLVLDASMTGLDVKRVKRGGFYLDEVAGIFEWKNTDDGWRFNSRDIHLVKQAQAWKSPSSIAVVQNKSGLALTATYMRSQDVISIANPFLNDKQIKTIKGYRPNHFSGDLYNALIFLPALDDLSMKLSADFEDLGFDLPNSEISFRGIDGSLRYEYGQVKLNLVSENVQMSFGDLFRHSLNADLLEGAVSIEQEDNNWNIVSENLYFLNSDLEAFTRLKLTVDEDETIFSDIQSDFRNVIGASIYKYYPVALMSDDLVGWLDMAISDGVVESGSFIMHGKLNDFPYAANDGVMEVIFDTRNLNLKFLESWPALNNLSSHVRFHNSSMLINGIRGKTYRGQLSNTTVSIPDLNEPRLFVKGHVDSPAEDIQQYIWNSGLDDIMGFAVRQFYAGGDIELDLNLEVPLHDMSEAVLAKGLLQFKNNELYFPVLDYTLNNVSGNLLFEGDKINAQSIKAFFENAPVTIDVAAEDDLIKEAGDSQPVSETIVHVNGCLPIDGLLRKFEWIPENWADGESDWDVAIHFPKKIKEYAVRVEMFSNLTGTAISLSDAVSKKEDDPLLVELEVKALGSALQVELESTDNITIFATRNDGKIWDFVVDSSLIRGSGEFAEDLNKDSRAKMDLEYIDLLTLFKSTGKGGDSVSLKPTFFPSLNFKSKVLIWNDWEFKNVSLDTSWHSHGMLVNSIKLYGPSLQVNGRGSWLTSWQNNNESNFKFFVKSDNFGNTLSALNLSKNMKRCEQNATIDWRWFDEPYRFSWQTVQGNAHFEMKDGEVKELDPGTGGRLVGLFNVFKLFNRLTLDFKDVAGEGFVFDNINGDFEFGDGYALSNNIQVKASAADMKLSGRVGMVDKNYDLNLQVKPHSSEAIFTTGLLAGGTGLGAGLVLINKLLGLEKSSYDEYKITGPWEDPKVEQVNRRHSEKNNEEGGNNE